MWCCCLKVSVVIVLAGKLVPSFFSYRCCLSNWRLMSMFRNTQSCHFMRQGFEIQKTSVDYCVICVEDPLLLPSKCLLTLGLMEF